MIETRVIRIVNAGNGKLVRAKNLLNNKRHIAKNHWITNLAIFSASVSIGCRPLYAHL